MWCKTDGEKEDRGPNADVGVEGNSGSDMAEANGVRWYGHVFRRADGHDLKKALEFDVTMTKEDVENASGEGEQECCFGEGGCLESSEMESGSWRDCCLSGVNLATPIHGINPDQNLMML